MKSKEAAADNVDGDLTGSVAVGGNLNVNNLGVYTLTYNVIDAAGNTALQATRSVRVMDMTAPVINLSGNSVSMKVRRSFIDPGYTASDTIDGDLTGSVVVGGNLDTDTVGSYTVTYYVNDTAGNGAAQRTKTVMVTPRVTSFDPATGVYTAPAGSTVTVSISSR